MVLVKQTQESAVSDVKFLEDKEQLGLALNEDGIWECHGHIQGAYPIYTPYYLRALVYAARWGCYGDGKGEGEILDSQVA